MGDGVMLGVGFLMFLTGSCLADSESFVPCLVFSLVGLAIMACELHKEKIRKGEKN
jgi:hypothetical protein